MLFPLQQRNLKNLNCLYSYNKQSLLGELEESCHLELLTEGTTVAYCSPMVPEVESLALALNSSPNISELLQPGLRQQGILLTYKNVEF